MHELSMKYKTALAAAQAIGINVACSRLELYRRLQARGYAWDVAVLDWAAEGRGEDSLRVMVTTRDDIVEQVASTIQGLIENAGMTLQARKRFHAGVELKFRPSREALQQLEGL